MPGNRKSTADASVESASRSYPPCAALRSSSVLSKTFKYFEGAWVADGERLCEREPVGLGVVDCDALPVADGVLVAVAVHRPGGRSSENDAPPPALVTVVPAALESTRTVAASVAARRRTVPGTAVRHAVGGVKEALQRRGMRRAGEAPPSYRASHDPRIQGHSLDDTEVGDLPLPLRIVRGIRGVVAANAKYGRRGADSPRDRRAACEGPLNKKRQRCAGAHHCIVRPLARAWVGPNHADHAMQQHYHAAADNGDFDIRVGVGRRSAWVQGEAPRVWIRV